MQGCRFWFWVAYILIAIISLKILNPLRDQLKDFNEHNIIALLHSMEGGDSHLSLTFIHDLDAINFKSKLPLSTTLILWKIFILRGVNIFFLLTFKSLWVSFTFTFKGILDFQLLMSFVRVVYLFSSLFRHFLHFYLLRAKLHFFFLLKFMGTIGNFSRVNCLKHFHDLAFL